MVTKLHPDFIVDSFNKKKAVILPIEEWKLIIEELEELDDIRSFDEANRTPSDTIPFDRAVREIRKQL